MGHMRSLPAGTRVIATKSFGPIIGGQLGMVTELARVSRGFWKRTVYACTFLGGIRVTASRRCIKKYSHACSSQVVEDPLWFLHTCQTPGKVDPYAFEATRLPLWPIH